MNADLLILECPTHGRVGPLGSIVTCGHCHTDWSKEIVRLRAEVHRLNNALTAAYLERDALKALLQSEQRASAALRRHVDPQGD